MCNCAGVTPPCLPASEDSAALAPAAWGPQGSWPGPIAQQDPAAPWHHAATATPWAQQHDFGDSSLGDFPSIGGQQLQPGTAQGVCDSVGMAGGAAAAAAAAAPYDSAGMMGGAAAVASPYPAPSEWPSAVDNLLCSAWAQDSWPDQGAALQQGAEPGPGVVDAGFALGHAGYMQAGQAGLDDMKEIDL